MLCATREMGFEVTAEDMAGLAGEHYWKDRWTGEMFAEVLLSANESVQQLLFHSLRKASFD